MSIRNSDPWFRLAATTLKVVIAVVVLSIPYPIAARQTEGGSPTGPATPEEQYELGRRYIEGDGVDQDLDAAIEWFRKAADQGHPAAEANLGHAYSAGQGWRGIRSRPQLGFARPLSTGSREPRCR